MEIETTSPTRDVCSAISSLRNSARSSALPDWCRAELSQAAAMISELSERCEAAERATALAGELPARCENAEREAHLYFKMLERAHGMSEALRESCPFRRMLAEKGEMERTEPDVVLAHELERTESRRPGSG